MKIKIILFLILLNLQSISFADVEAIYDWDNEQFEGDIYIGEVNESGFIHGIGIYYFKNGDTAEGEFKKGQQTGYGLQTLSDGNSYRGEIHRWERNGYGIAYFRDSYFLGHHRDDGYFYEGNCGIVRYKNGNGDEFYCYENGNFKRLTFINIQKNDKARKNSKRAENARNRANVIIREAQNNKSMYLQEWPYALLEKKELCLRSTTLGGVWEKDNKFLNYVKEAKKRYLTEKICSSVTGRTIEKEVSEILGTSTEVTTINGNEIIKHCFLNICVEEEKVGYIWIGIFVLVLFILLLIGKILSSNKKIDFKTTKIEEKSENIQVIKKDKSLGTSSKKDDEPTKEKVLSEKKTEESMDRKNKLHDDKHISVESKIPEIKEEINVVKSETKIVEKEINEKIKNNVLKIDADEEKKEPIIDNNLELKIDRKKEEIKKKTINKISISEPTETKTKVCSFCETENFGENLNCIICNKSLA